MKKVIRRLTSNDGIECQKMLDQAFSSSKGFMVHSNGSRWSYADSFYPTLGIFHDDVLVSSMRVEWVLSLNELNYKMLTKLQFPFDVTFPAMYLTKAGTLPGIKAKGLNSLLRYCALKMAQNWNARYVFGTMVEGSPRVFTMQEMGYQFMKNNEHWDGNFISNQIPLLAWLDLETHGKQAFDYLESSLGSLLQEYQIDPSVRNCAIDPNPLHKFPWVA